MAYEIIDARFANQDRTAIVITTEDVGDVALSERDTPELWAKVQDWQSKGNLIRPHVPIQSDPRRDPNQDLAALKALLVQKGVLLPSDIASGVRDVSG